MTTYTYSELELKVLDFLCKKYDVLYKGKLRYTAIPDDDVSYYKLEWGLNQQDYPFVMQGQFINEDKFYDYVCKQIAINKFYLTEYFIARKKGKVDAYEVEGYKDALLTFDERTL